MDLKMSNLPPQFENIAIEIGIDRVRALFKEFGRISVYFPTEKMIYKEARDREIIEDFIVLLGHKYNFRFLIKY